MSTEYDIPNIIHYRKKKPNHVIPKYERKCIKCQKEFIGYKNQKQCFECLNAPKGKAHPFICSRCGRRTKALSAYGGQSKPYNDNNSSNSAKEYLCSFCLSRAKGSILWAKEHPVKTPDNKPKLTKTCPQCKTVFHTNYKQKLFCNIECSSRYHYLKNKNPQFRIKVGVCPECKKPFTYIYRQIYCSEKCKKQYYDSKKPHKHYSLKDGD